jgi:hypothetical protein
MNKHSKRFAKFVAVSALLFNIVGCAGLLAPVANWIDKQDECQTKSRPPNTPAPSYCGAASGHTLQVARGAYNGTYLINTK